MSIIIKTSKRVMKKLLEDEGLLAALMMSDISFDPIVTLARLPSQASTARPK